MVFLRAGSYRTVTDSYTVAATGTRAEQHMRERQKAATYFYFGKQPKPLITL